MATSAYTTKFILLIGQIRKNKCALRKFYQVSHLILTKSATGAMIRSTLNAQQGVQAHMSALCFRSTLADSNINLFLHHMP
jgi:hypothetical protein